MSSYRRLDGQDIDDECGMRVRDRAQHDTFHQYQYDTRAKVNGLFMVRPVTSNITLLSTDHYVFVDAATTDITVTLPTTPLMGQMIVIKKTDITTHQVTVNGAPFTVDGLAYFILTKANPLSSFVFDGSVWRSL